MAAAGPASASVGFGLDSGEFDGNCDMGRAYGRITWGPGYVIVMGTMSDRPFDGDDDEQCGDDGRLTHVLVSSLMNGATVGQDDFTIDNGHETFKAVLPSGDIVEVQLCRGEPDDDPICGRPHEIPTE